MNNLIVVAHSLDLVQEFYIVDKDNINAEIFLHDGSLGYSKVDAALEKKILKDWQGEKKFRYEEPLFGWYIAKVIIQ